MFVCYGNVDEGRRKNERVANWLEDVVDDVFIVTLPEGINDFNDLFVRAENATEVFVSLINRAIQTKQESGIAPDSHYLTMYNEEYVTFDGFVTLFKTVCESTRKAGQNGADLTSA